MEMRIFGPPGTGKTTYLSRQVRLAVEKRGSQAVLIASFTRAAAAELAGRSLPVGRDQIGTLHAHAYRALGRPRLVETPEMMAEWNRENPTLALAEIQHDVDDPLAVDATTTTDNDARWQRIQVLRQRRIPTEQWPGSLRSFFQRWCEWKRSLDGIDFTDMIEVALRDVAAAPGEPEIGFFDEAQDFTALELALVRRWGQEMDLILLAGDDDQCLYAFKGSSPEAFLDPPLPVEQKRILAQSYRVPRQVQSCAQDWIQRVERREEKVYHARDEDGEVRYLLTGEGGKPAGTWKNIEPIVQDAEQYLAEGKRVMFLTSCAYMLNPLQAVLRSRGIPFHNPYRRKRGDWNPLYGGRGVSAAERIYAFLAPLVDDAYTAWRRGYPEIGHVPVWRAGDLQQWMASVRAEVFRRGSKTAIEQQDAESETTPLRTDFLERWFPVEHLAAAANLDLAWLEKHLLESKVKTHAYPIAVARHQGAMALRAEPQIVIGTIHSVKGGEADVVYLFPDLSWAGMGEWARSGARDAIRRMVYVGMTRARETLVLCAPASSIAVTWPRQ